MQCGQYESKPKESEKVAESTNIIREQQKSFQMINFNISNQDF